MGYEIQLQKELLTLLGLFRDKAHDRETNTLVHDLIADEAKWNDAHDLFRTIRNRLLAATGDAGRLPVDQDRIDRALVSQYYFEELCLKTIYNETPTDRPFDSCSPFWVVGSAIQLARELDIPIAAVVEIVAPSKARK